MTEPRHAVQAWHAPCGEGCGSSEPGHDLHPIRARATAATASQWTDAVIVTVNASGVIEVADVFTDAHHVVWHHSDLTESVRPGEPVAFHRRYGVLALGRAWLSVRALGQAR